MKTIIIPEQIYEVPNWVYWLYSHPHFFAMLIVIGFALSCFLYFFLIERYHGDP